MIGKSSNSWNTSVPSPLCKRTTGVSQTATADLRTPAPQDHKPVCSSYFMNDTSPCPGAKHFRQDPNPSLERQSHFDNRSPLISRPFHDTSPTAGSHANGKSGAVEAGPGDTSSSARLHCRWHRQHRGTRGHPGERRTEHLLEAAAAGVARPRSSHRRAVTSPGTAQRQHRSASSLLPSLACPRGPPLLLSPVIGDGHIHTDPYIIYMVHTQHIYTDSIQGVHTRVYSTE